MFEIPKNLRIFRNLFFTERAVMGKLILPMC